MSMLLKPHHHLEAGEVHVWRLLVEELRIPAMADAMRAILSPQERARMNCFGHERDRTLFLLSRGLMRSVLGSYLRCECEELLFNVTTFGKPILDVSPPVPLQFNLTHSRGAVAMAVSRDRDVGVDVEERSRRVDYLGLADRYFAADEARYLATLSEEERPDAFFAIWTLKEAYVKGIGRGLTFPLDVFAFDLKVSQLIGFRPLSEVVECDWQFHQFDVGERHCGAVAVRGSGATILLRDWITEFVSK